MRFFFSFAGRNLMRYTKRTLITAFATAFGIVMFLFVDSLLQGGERDSERNLIWYETSSVRIYQSENVNVWERANLKHLINEPTNLLATLRDRGIHATKRTSFAAEMIVYRDPFPEDGSLHVRVTAIDPATDSSVYRFRQDLTEGSSWLEQGTNKIIMGSWMAEDLGADIGYPVTLLARTRDGAFQTIDLEIAGLAYTGNPVINRSAILMDASYANDLLLLGGAASQIDIAFPVTSSAEENTEVVSSILRESGLASADLSILSWRDIASDYLSLAASKQSGSIVILGLIFIIVLVGISNTMLLSMYERRRELGMMRALGMKNSEITTCFLLEAGGIGAIGGAIGLLLGLAAVAFLVEVGLNYEFILRDFDAGYRVASVFRGVWRPGTFLLAFISAVIMSMLAAVIPTRHALNMTVSDCLRADT